MASFGRIEHGQGRKLMKMQRRRLSIVVAGALALLLAVPVSAHAVFFPGTRLVELMREYEKSETGGKDVLWGNVGRFEGYIMGVCDALDNSLVLLDRATPAQITAAVAKYLNANPQRWNLPAIELVKLALLDSFPRR
jgi:hypothetical protein